MHATVLAKALVQLVRAAYDAEAAKYDSASTYVLRGASDEGLAALVAYVNREKKA